MTVGAPVPEQPEGRPDGAAGRRSTAVIVRLDIAAAVICAVAAVASVVIERPVPGLIVLALPAVPLVAVGQVWSIVVGNAWIRARGGPIKRVGALGALLRNLRARARVGAAAGFYGGWLIGMTSFVFLIHGGPGSPTSTCSYPLVSHGSVTCVSQLTYERAGAAQQRLFAGILMAFFSAQAAICLATITPERSTRTTRTG